MFIIANKRTRNYAPILSATLVQGAQEMLESINGDTCTSCVEKNLAREPDTRDSKSRGEAHRSRRQAINPIYDRHVMSSQEPIERAFAE